MIIELLTGTLYMGCKTLLILIIFEYADSKKYKRQKLTQKTGESNGTTK